MNIATLDLNLLRVFDALMEARSVTRGGSTASAAYSPPATTRGHATTRARTRQKNTGRFMS